LKNGATFGSGGSTKLLRVVNIGDPDEIGKPWMNPSTSDWPHNASTEVTVKKSVL